MYAGGASVGSPVVGWSSTGTETDALGWPSFERMTPLDDEAPRAWDFSGHADCRSGSCPANGVELEPGTAPKEGPGTVGIVEGEFMT